MLQLRHYIFVYICLSMGYQILSVPIEYDISESERELSYDFDTEQSQARYDPRLLSEELKDSRSTSQEGAAACYTAELKYEHGEKVTRNDPCEVCLCVDGEIFCWWKKCDNAKRKKEVRKSRQQMKSSHHNRRKPTHKNQSTKFKAMKYIPKNVLNFPQHLPAIRQYDFNQNDTKSIFQHESEKSYLPKMSGRKKPLKMDTKPPTFRPPLPPPSMLADSPYRDDSMTILKGRREDMNKEMPYSDKQHSNRQQQQQQQQQQQHKQQKQQHREKALEQQHRQQGGLYEKAVINDDGVFVEKVNKINDISEELKGSNNNNNNSNNSSNKESIQSSDAGRDGNSNGVPNGGNGPLDNSNGVAKPLDFSQNEKIQFVDVPLAKHYIITSSGSVENTDILASDNVLSQFRNGYSVVVESPSRTTDGNSTTRPDALVRSPPLGVGDSNAASASIVTPSAALAAATTVTTNIADVTAIIAPSSSLLSSSYSSQPVQMSGSFLSSSLSADALSSSSPSSSSSSSTSSLSSLSDLSSAQHRNNGVASSSSGGDSTVEPPPQEQQCVVMGTSYKIGTILPQDTGNCLQCICIEGASEGDTPRVTCSPHNCPPLVLPDLFDTTGY